MECGDFLGKQAVCLVVSFFFFFFLIYFWLFRSLLLCGLFSSCGDWGLSLVAVTGFMVVASFAVGHEL